MEHRLIDHGDGWLGAEPHHHIVNVTVCGSWWGGAPDERNIPHATMSDGAPNGYGLITFDGVQYSHEYRAASRPADYQMEIFAPETVLLADAPHTRVYVNVFAGSARSTVEMRFGDDGSWTALPQVFEVDPGFAAVVERERQFESLQLWTKLPQPHECTHLWAAPLPAPPGPGTHLLHVRTTDMFGHTYHDRRTIKFE
jgi:hypothetical protein